MTSELHEAYLNLGSNIQPEDHFRKAIELLGKSGRVKAVSTVWESRAVGAQGPNFFKCVRTLQNTFQGGRTQGANHPVRQIGAWPRPKRGQKRGTHN